MADDRDLARLRAVALALDELATRVVFVGGSVTSLMITDPAAPPTRLSNDVDAVLPGVSRATYYAFEHRLRELGFAQRADEPTCRWFKNELVVDVMPDDREILGFSNRWYASAAANAETRLIDGVTIRIVRPIWFLATKLEAFAGRGKGDFQASRDIEDIVAVVDGRPEFLDELTASPDDVRTFVRASFSDLLADEAFVIAIVGHLGGDSDRATIVIERLTTATL
jgi:hypothetical protein